MPPASDGFLLALFFYSENGENMFLWNVELSLNYKALQLRITTTRTSFWLGTLVSTFFCNFLTPVLHVSESFNFCTKIFIIWQKWQNLILESLNLHLCYIRTRPRGNIYRWNYNLKSNNSHSVQSMYPNITIIVTCYFLIYGVWESIVIVEKKSVLRFWWIYTFSTP